MLMKNGLYSAIVDAFDNDLTDIVTGKKDNLVQLVHKIMDGENVDMGSLSEDEVKYAKSVKVLMGESLFSDSWLEV